VIPWIPASGGPRKDAKIIHISADPLVSRYPFKEIDADLLMAGDTGAALRGLREALSQTAKKNSAADARRKTVATARDEIAARKKKLIETVKDQSPIHLAYLAHCINRVKARDAIVISELGVPLPQLEFTAPRSYMGNLLSGGLGFGLGAALGAKLAAPEREVITTVGDGSYMFGNPLPYHYVGRAEKLPTLTIVTNNHMWGAVRQSTLDVYPDGKAAKANSMPLTELTPSPDFEKVVETCGGIGLKVDTPDQIMPALEKGLAAVRSGTPATLNVRTQAR
jgi:acetolactate synthase-1/2/3 large subunit